MSRGFYGRLAKDNIKKNGKIYLPYILTITLSVAMFYIIQSLAINPGFQKMLGYSTMNEILMFACWVVRIFIVIFLLYTNSFLIKRRKKEFGVFHVLGMEKKHLSITLFWESLYVLAISLVVGLVAGILLDKLMFMILIRMLGFQVPLGFFVSPKAILNTILLFAVVSLVNYLYDVAQIRGTTPIDLLRGENVGEKEPKAKWFMALLGCLALAGGYSISIMIKDPVASIPFFFVAVLLVIFGTYLLFTAGSIALLKLLKKNKKFYYKTSHFASVSGMIYRMKQNAVGLAHICILSTMVLVMVSTTTSMMVGMKDILYTRHPMQIMCYGAKSDRQTDMEMIKKIRNLVKDEDYNITKENYYRGLELSGTRDGSDIKADPYVNYTGTDECFIFFFMSLTDYNNSLGTSEKLNPGEILVYSGRKLYGEKELNILGNSYKVKKEVEEMPLSGELSANIRDTIYVVLPDDAALEELNRIAQEQLGSKIEGGVNYIYHMYGFDIDGDDEAQKEVYIKLKKFLNNSKWSYNTECRAASGRDMMALYGGLFFTGTFLGMLFLMATVLIIYYKQMSEGYDDQKRFAIMQQVGMTKKEVSATIRSQVLMVFFLPLVVAGIHLCFAFPIISRLLKLFNMLNTKLYVECLAGCFLIFALVYVAIYLVTAKAYNRIVQK